MTKILYLTTLFFIQLKCLAQGVSTYNATKIGDSLESRIVTYFVTHNGNTLLDSARWEYQYKDRFGEWMIISGINGNFGNNIQIDSLKIMSDSVNKDLRRMYQINKLLTK